MTFHAYFRYVCLFLTCLYMAFSAHMHAQEYRQRSDTTRTLLIIDGENGGQRNNLRDFIFKHII